MSPTDHRGGSSRSAEPLRVAYWPRWRGHPYLHDLYAATERHGVTAMPAKPLDLLRGRIDVTHLHWPDLVWAGSPLRKVIKGADVSSLVAATRIRRRRLVVTAHNLRAHDGSDSRIARWICSALLARADAIITLSDEGRERLRAVYPACRASRIDVIPLTDLRTHYRPIARENGHRMLGIQPCPPGTLRLVWFGQIRGYKGLDVLFDLVASDRDLPVRVLVLGRSVDARTGEELRRRAAGDERFEIISRRVTDAEICAACAISDCAVFPFRSVENSASVLTALATDTPVIVPAIGGMPELAREYGSEWVRIYDPPLDAAALLALARRARPAAPPISARRSPEQVGALQAALYRDVLAAGRP